MGKLNKKGFTLSEVLTVIVVITVLMMITLPLINSITKKNSIEVYKSYERMMEEYAMASGIKNKDKIYLSELNGLDKISEDGCDGYVEVTETPKNYKAHLDCGSKYNTDTPQE